MAIPTELRSELATKPSPFVVKAHDVGKPTDFNTDIPWHLLDKEKDPRFDLPLAGQLGAGAITAQAAKYGFGSSISVPMTAVSSCVGPRATDDCMSIQGGTPGTYQSGIGQRDVQETPLQNALVAATIANGGKEMQPQLVESLLAPDLSTIQGFSPQVMNDDVISPQVATDLIGGQITMGFINPSIGLSLVREGKNAGSGRHLFGPRTIRARSADYGRGGFPRI